MRFAKLSDELESEAYTRCIRILGEKVPARGPENKESKSLPSADVTLDSYHLNLSGRGRTMHPHTGVV